MIKNALRECIFDM